MKTRLADYVVQRCLEAGITDCFMVTGGGAMHLNDAFGKALSMQITCFHHEQAAAIAADGYFRIANKLAVVNVTTGPGGINAMNGVFGAFVDSLAMLVISGQVKSQTYSGSYELSLRQLGDQEANIVSMISPITKYSTVVRNPEDIAWIMDKALFIATHGRPGPVWIDIPIDIQGALIEVDGLARFSVSKESLSILADDPDVHPNAQLELRRLPLDRASSSVGIEFDEIFDKLNHSKRPVLLAGTGIRIAGVYREFLDFVDKLRIPVVTGWNAHDLLPWNNQYYVGRSGTVGDRAGNFAVQNADFLLILGCRLNIRQISYNWQEFSKNSWKVMVDADESELNKPTLNINLPICADLRWFLPEILKRCDKAANLDDRKKFLDWCKGLHKKYPVCLPTYAESVNVNPYHLINTLFERMQSDELIVAGNGSACVMGFQAAKIQSGQRFFTNSGNASMGYDLPAAIGASLASKGRRVICITGDGSIMMNLQELQTIIGNNLPIKVLLLNNNGYHSIRQTQAAYFPETPIGNDQSTGVSFPDFIKLFNSFGFNTKRISKTSELDAGLDWYLNQVRGCCLLEVMIDLNQTFSPKLASKKLSDGSMVSPSLEVMFPFLSDEEMQLIKSGLD